VEERCELRWVNKMGVLAGPFFTCLGLQGRRAIGRIRDRLFVGIAGLST
jgi:hypothetical protein